VKQIYRCEVPLDDEWHDFDLSGPIVAVGAVARKRDVIEFWWEYYSKGLAEKVQLRVFGTGHYMPDLLEHVGTTIAGGLVWHLMKKPRG